MTYTDIDEVQAYLRTTYDANSSPTLTEVNALIIDTDELVNEIAGTVFDGVATGVQVFNFDTYVAELFPEKLPLRSVTSLFKNSIADKYETPVFDVELTYVQDRNLLFLKNPVGGKNACQLTYTYGFDTVPVSVKKLATLLTVRGILASEEQSTGAFSEVQIGPIKAKSAAGGSRLINLSADIINYTRLVGKYKKVVA